MTHLPVVILAGGYGTRIQEVSGGAPKALIKILGKPFLYWKLEELINQGITEIFILGHFGSSQIRHFLDKYVAGDTQITFIDDGETPKGTGGAIKSALNKLPDLFILTYGDNLLQQRIQEIVDAHKRFGTPDLLVLTENISSAEVANTAVTGNLVTAYSKIPIPEVELTYLEYGYSVWSSDTFKLLPASDTPIDMSTVINQSCTNQTLSAFITKALYYEIGTPEGLKLTETWLASREIGST